jgi:cellulose synthase/poly-beta-1,6-N-acetylglucosamine synthase-like glycosyltransferase
MGAVYIVLLALLGLYALHRGVLLALYFRGRRPGAAPLPPELPAVTVQLPIYNEATVAERLLEAVAGIRWPRDRLEIQVLDDSTDETAELVAAKVAELRARGLDAVHLRRGARTGFKAGALRHGLERARGELCAVFDADFVPPPDILERTVGWFSDPNVGMVQARWGHLNRRQSLLTQAQALLLDGHFVIEHGARSRAGCFFNFSGTAGIWRVAAVVDAGGWQADTLTEDMDLSVRAQLRGWRFVFLPDVVVPAELPADVNAFRSQQFRWAKGQVQVARKLAGAVARAPSPPWKRVDGLVHLTSNVSYLLLLLACLALPWTVGDSVAAGPFLVGTALVVAFYAAAQREIGGDALGAIVRAPFLLALCAGLSAHQSRAVIEGLAGRTSGFVRTPKAGVGPRRYRAPASGWAFLELGMAAYLAVGAAAAAAVGAWATLGFSLLFGGGFAYVGAASLRGRRG